MTAAAMIIAIASLVSNVVGVLRDHTLAATFGAGPSLDAYYAAFRVPDFIYNLVIVGSLSAGFIPVFAEYLETREKSEAWHLAEQVLSVVGATMVVLCLVLAVFAPVIVPMTVPGFSPDKLALTIRMARIMFLSPLFLGMSAVMGGILQATRRFMAFSIAPIIYNLGIIFGATILVPRMGVEGVAWGVVLGAFLHFIVQASVALRLGLRRIPWPSLQTAGVRRILKLMLPRTAGLAVSQLNLVILLIFASALAEGSVAVFNLANNLQSFAVSVIGISYAVAAFPVLSKAAGRKDVKGFQSALLAAAQKITFFILPFTACFFLFRAQIVRLALGAGQFDWNDTVRTATVLGVFTISLLGQSLVALYARAFYAVQDTKRPLVIALVSESINLFFAYTLRGPMGIAGLVTAFTIATYVQLALLLWQLRRHHGLTGGKAYATTFFQAGAASVAFIAAGYPVRQLVGTIFPLTQYWQVVLQGGLAGIAGLAGFILVCWLLKAPEFFDFLSHVNRRLFKNKVAIAGAEEAQGL